MMDSGVFGAIVLLLGLDCDTKTYSFCGNMINLSLPRSPLLRTRVCIMYKHFHSQVSVQFNEHIFSSMGEG